MAERIQRRRTRGWRMPPNTRCVDRTSQWGNPFRVGGRYMWLHSTELSWPIPTHREPGVYDHGLEVVECPDPATAVAWFKDWLLTCDRSFEGYDTEPLRGKNLACWCPLDQPCHADVLLDIANKEELRG